MLCDTVQWGIILSIVENYEEKLFCRKVLDYSMLWDTKQNNIPCCGIQIRIIFHGVGYKAEKKYSMFWDTKQNNIPCCGI